MRQLETTEIRLNTAYEPTTWCQSTKASLRALVEPPGGSSGNPKALACTVDVEDTDTLSLSGPRVLNP